MVFLFPLTHSINPYLEASLHIPSSLQRLALPLPAWHLSTFAYQPLSTKDREIRLLHFLPDNNAEGGIECSLQNTRLDDCREYQALSYTWGDGETSREITINGERFPVTENLYCAL